MKFQHVLEIVNCQPWLITPQGHASIRALVQSKLDGVAFDIKEMMPDLEAARIENGIGIVPIKGVIGKGLSKLEKSCGATDIKDVLNEISDLLSDETCNVILLDVDSPGGTVTGVPELAAKIAAADNIKPVFAFTDGQMDSAAYWIASGAREIIASPSAEVGSIGVYMPWADYTRAYEADGVKVEVIKNTGGTYKGMGMPGTALTTEQRQHLQNRVDEIFKMFTSAVNGKRRVEAEAMQGQTFMAESAKATGLIGVVGDFEDAIAECLQAS